MVELTGVVQFNVFLAYILLIKYIERIKEEIKDFLLQINCANHCGAHIADYLLLNIK